MISCGVTYTVLLIGMWTKVNVCMKSRLPNIYDVISYSTWLTHSHQAECSYFIQSPLVSNPSSASPTSAPTLSTSSSTVRQAARAQRRGAHRGADRQQQQEWQRRYFSEKRRRFLVRERGGCLGPLRGAVYFVSRGKGTPSRSNLGVL